VPIKKIMDQLGLHFVDDLGPFRHVLTTSYFILNGHFYEYTDGVSMDSPLSLVITNVYMEDYMKAVLELASQKHHSWFC
jgi:hypothetical protein